MTPPAIPIVVLVLTSREVDSHGTPDPAACSRLFTEAVAGHRPGLPLRLELHLGPTTVLPDNGWPGCIVCPVRPVLAELRAATAPYPTALQFKGRDANQVAAWADLWNAGPTA